MTEDEKKVERDKVLREVVREWNTLIKGLVMVKKSWDNYSMLRLDNNVKIEEFPVECQKALMKANPKGQLDFILEDMITQGKAYEDYLKTQYIRIK